MAAEDPAQATTRTERSPRFKVRRFRQRARRSFRLISLRIEAIWTRALAWAPPWNGPQAYDAQPGSGPVLDHVQAALRRPLFAGALFSLAMNLLALTVPIYMSQVYDRVLTSYSVETLLMLTFLALGLLLLFVALDHLRMAVITRAALRGEQSLGAPLLGAAVHDQIAGRTDAGLALRDLAALRAFAMSPALTAFFDAPLVPLFVILIFLIHWVLGAVALAGALGMVVLAAANQKTTAKLVEQAGKSSNALFFTADQQTRNANVIQAMGLLPDLARRWGRNQDRALSEHLRAGEAGAFYYMGTRFLRLALQVVLLALGAGLVISREITPGMMFATSIIFARGLQPVEVAVGSWRTLVSARASWKRVHAALERLDAQPAAMLLPDPEGRIEAEGITYFCGPERRPVLKGVSFALGAGEILGIIGPAAAGKSTLARMVLGVISPTTGKVRLDGADIAQWPRAALGRHIGYLPQEVELFPGTVAENIARMGEIDNEKVVAAAHTARVHDMILRLPQGYDTRIMAGGLILSPGQRQRIALARAFYGTPRVIVLDEPNSNLDGEGEDALADALKEAKTLGQTVLVIAHRLGVLRYTEKVLLLRDGAIQAFGPRDEVLARLTPSLSAQNSTVVPLVHTAARPGAS
jgi:PrtD family type I secretion system ABC transporter